MSDQNFKPGSDDNAKQHFADAALEEMARIGKRDDEAFLSRMDSLLDEVDSETKVQAAEFTPMPRPNSRRNATLSIIAAAAVIICLLPVFLTLQSKKYPIGHPHMVVAASAIEEELIEQKIRPDDYRITPEPDNLSFATALPTETSVTERIDADTFFGAPPEHPGGNISIGYDSDYLFQGKRLEIGAKETPAPNTTYIDEKDLIVDVTEKPGGSLSFGAGLSSIDSISGFVDIKESNFELSASGSQRLSGLLDDSEAKPEAKTTSLATLGAGGEIKLSPVGGKGLSIAAEGQSLAYTENSSSGKFRDSGVRTRSFKARGISESSPKSPGTNGDETNLYVGVEEKMPFLGDLPVVERLLRENTSPTTSPATTENGTHKKSAIAVGRSVIVTPPQSDVFHGGVSLSVDFGDAPTAAPPTKAQTPKVQLEVGKGNHTADKVIRRKIPQAPAPERERYGELVDNTFLSPLKDPLSTFSVDVDTASYSNIRRMVRDNIAIPANAVRIEEMINYFSYNYPQPEGKHPFAFAVETAECPWNGDHQLMRVGIQGKSMDRGKRPDANLVFLLDVSGSMNPENKLPLVKKSMSLMIEELTERDTVSLVVYAGAEGLCLPPTSGNQKEKILKSLSNLKSGGSTNGGAGIQLAYKLAKENYKKDGINRVILCTDGDFNVGRTDEGSLVDMVEKRAKDGTFLSVLGFGSGNINDSMLEAITNKGNGNYFYIDSLKEGRKVLLQDLMSTLVTIAKDVKIQIEFNPKHVQNYRLIGYANRMLKAEDFENDKVDAGEIGAGHSVTALYEIVPAGAPPVRKNMTNLKYQQPVKPDPPKMKLVESDELCTLKLRYKLPKSDKSIPMEKPVNYQSREWTEASDDFQFAAAVGLWGMLLRNGEYYGKGTVEDVLEMAKEGRAEDPFGRRDEFIQLVKQWNKAVALSKSNSDNDVFHGGTSIKVEF